MTPAHTTYGLVDGEKPPILHRLGTIAERSCCGKKITILPAGDRPHVVECRRCTALENARRAGIPDWFDSIGIDG